jgi:hypothetical protein
MYAGIKPEITAFLVMDLAFPFAPIRKPETPVISAVVGGLLKLPTCKIILD